MIRHKESQSICGSKPQYEIYKDSRVSTTLELTLLPSALVLSIELGYWVRLSLTHLRVYGLVVVCR